MDEIRLRFLGGSDRVGSLALLTQMDGKNLLFDYGLTPSKPPEYPLPAPPVDLVFLSHAHLDHSGMIPALLSGLNQRLITTRLTWEISDILHKDTLKIARSDGYAIPYTLGDIHHVKHCLHPVKPNRRYHIGDDLEVKFHSSGHIPGSLMFELQGSRRFLFTGDINVIDTRLVRGCKPVECDVLCMEGTYAGREHQRRDELEKTFLDKIDEVVSRGGRVVLPAFAVARAQELLLILRNSGFNVWFDGMGKKVTQVYFRYPRCIRSVEQLKKAYEAVNIVHSDYGRKLALKGEVILTSSGMMDGGPVLHYMNKLKNDTKSAVLLTGYQVEDTNSRLLVEEGKLDFYGVIEPVHCEIDYFDFSAHAGHSQLIDFARKCKPEKVVLMHSDNRSILAEELRDFVDEVYTPMDGEEIIL